MHRRYTDQAFLEGEAGLTAAAAAGRELWYKATFGNAQFHAEILPELGFAIDWRLAFGSALRAQRWLRWGLINDPSCCTPGAPGCPVRDPSTTYGFDYCAGDDELLPYVGKQGYKDPACGFREGATASRSESGCLLAFGTSAGAVGWRKFPNPRFDAQRWASGNASTSWEGYPARPVQDRVEPPFLFGIACAACHAGFDALNAPSDPSRPQWDHLRATAGNQTLRFGEILTSALPRANALKQWAAFARPGTVDTSLIENDYIANPSSINAIINIEQRPRANGVHALMKGGEDSTGFLDSIRRVYLSMGVCAQQCLLGHLENPNEWRPGTQRYEQSPVDLPQCRRDCAAFRALDERAEAVFAFMSGRDARPTDLRVAREREKQRASPDAVYARRDFVADLEREFGRNAVERGRRVFAAECARCHSSAGERAGESGHVGDFLQVDGVTGERTDWLGNDAPTPVEEVGTYACRALHTNHSRGNIWAPFASDDYQRRGPGYYRNVSLLSVWAHAPFMHNDAVGPPLCRSPRARGCWRYDPSVAGRYGLFKASMRELLSLRRNPKRELLAHEVVIPIELPGRVPGRSQVDLIVPRGSSLAALGNFAVKRFARDLDAAGTSIAKKEQSPTTRLLLKRLAREAASAQRIHIDLQAAGLRPYLNCPDQVENAGHRYGTQLSLADKRALTAFLATL